MRLRPVENARSAWRWFSVQFAALGVAVEIAWRYLTPEQVLGIPDWAQSTITVVIFLGVLLGRLIDQGGKDGAD